MSSNAHSSNPPISVFLFLLLKRYIPEESFTGMKDDPYIWSLTIIKGPYLGVTSRTASQYVPEPKSEPGKKKVGRRKGLGVDILMGVGPLVSGGEGAWRNAGKRLIRGFGSITLPFSE